MKHLAVIPARGGSKRIPRKNVRPFAGRPMIAHAIAVAQASGLFARIVVSTDDDEIAGVAQAAGAEVPFRRPAALADDHDGTGAVMAHALDKLRWPDAALACCLYPAVPLLRGADLAAALALLEDGQAHFAYPVLAFESPVQRALRRDTDGRTTPLYPQFTETRTQDLEPAFHDAGQFYWGRSAAWRRGASPLDGGRSIVLQPWQAVDIDTPDDWARAEAIYASRLATTQPA